MRASLVLLGCAFLLTGCHQAERDFGFSIAITQAQQIGETVLVRATQKIELSEEAREALRHGVTIRLQVDLELRRAGSWSDTAAARVNYQLDYLPLSDRYQVSGPISAPSRPAQSSAAITSSSYPRLRHALAAMAELNYVFEGVAPGSGPYQVRARSRIDRSGMPGPMQLPALLSSQWHHDSGWTSEAVEPQHGAAG